ncbi:MAG: putative lipopolysaccharide heptosyltransferase III [Geobacteraceae bacterium GWC2_58_44]|nr:MAG: putative lipopolysaccharide heptosyltransferase III [Geobacteraceae bacterium GWC2_58_44]
MVDKSRIRKILVIKLRNIGDVLLSAPLFDNLKLAFPGARISALVNAGTQEMLTGNPALEQVMVYDRSIKKAPVLRRLGGELAFYRRVRRERFDLVLNLTEGDRGALVALFSGARLRLGLDPMNRGLAGKRRYYTHLLPRDVEGKLHAVEKNLVFLAPLGLEPVRKRVSFWFSELDRGRVTTLLAAHALAPGGFFHAHVTSRWMFKALPHAKAAYLLDRLSGQSGLPMVLTCAPEQKELDYLAALRPLLRQPFADLSGALSLKQLGALSASARFFAGVDSAPMHMAAALDVPTLGIFGPSSVPEWGPWDNALQENPYRNRNGVQQSGRHLVLQGASPCVPCYRDGCNGSKVSDCLDFPEQELDSAATLFLGSLGCEGGR